jgi:D-alanine-D-alanine ligase
MNIGITYDLKSDHADPTLPDDHQEEFDSPRTIDALARALEALGHHVTRLGDGRGFLEKVLAAPPDFVFNLAEGTGVSRAREARVPAVLEMLGIPHSGSDPLTLAATLDKACARTLVAAAGMHVPAGYALAPGEPLDAVPAERLRFPIVAKPAWEGSSKGIRNRNLIDTPAQLRDTVAHLRRDHCQTILLEEYIDGDEITVGILGNDPARVLGVMRVSPRQPAERFIYSLEIKRDYRRLVKYDCPPPLPPATLVRIEQAALEAHRVLGCRDVSRIDFRMQGDTAYFLEANPLPGLNPDDSDLVIMAKLVGWSYQQLIEAILQAALRRAGMDN